MFNSNKDNETDFCESYKSQILGNNEREEGNSFFSTIVKLLTILILLVTIIGVSFYGYNYFSNSQKINNIVLPPVSMQVSDDDLVVEMEEAKIEPVKIKLEQENLIEKADIKEVDQKEVSVKKEEKIPMPLIVTVQPEELDIEQIANEVKIAIAKSELKEENETKIEIEVSEVIEPKVEVNNTEELESLEVPTSVPEAKYLEELADLSKEIDKERNN